MREERHLWESYVKQGGEPHSIVKHMFLDYSRYYEAQLISQWFIDNNIRLDFPILDYGCGVGDYGIYLLRQGAIDVDMYDFPRATNFVNYRLEQEGLAKGRVINADEETIDFDQYDLFIFGEVLEHLDSPYSLLKKVVASQPRFIFTSSYPYRTDDASDPYWSNHDHNDNARLLMPKCRKLLEDNFNYTKFDGELRLWVRK